ncbi:hypothetical protein [Aliikangiella maris]|uniref:Uncharacterized protein n=2 Tax=Aliikangiella maris TaxID=3162458 RepID=A0ABV2BY01_9GAMM
MMENFLEIEYINDNPSKIRVKASNGYYAGFCETYINRNWFRTFSEKLKRFPHEVSEVVFESEPGLGEKATCYIKVYLKDKLGHVNLCVALKYGVHSYEAIGESKFIIDCELSQLDSFSKSLDKALNSDHCFVKLIGSEYI